MARGDIAKRGPGPGRPKGSKDKLPTELRARMIAIAEQLEAKGMGLDVEAEKDPRWFYETFIRPLLPKAVDATLSGNIGALTVEQVDALARYRKKIGVSDDG